MSACVFIALECLASLSVPVGAVIRFPTAAPIWIVFAGMDSLFGLPTRGTFVRAQQASCCMRLFNLKLFAALLALYCDTLLQVWIWMRQRFSETSQRTKTRFAPFAARNYLAANLANLFANRRLLEIFMRVAVLAFTRTIFAGPRTLILKLFTTFRASCESFSAVMAAFFRTKFLRCFLVGPKEFMTMRTFFLELCFCLFFQVQALA